MKTLGYKIATICFAALITACGGTQFSASGKKKQAAPQQPADAFGQAVPLGANSIQESFTLSSTQQSKPVDIIFVVDTSGSMREEKALLEQKMGFFIQNLTANSQNMDYHIYLVGDGFNVLANYDPSRLTLVNERVGSHDALEVLANFLSGQLGNASFHRPNADRHAIVISDDNAAGQSGGPATMFGMPFGLPFGGSRGITAAEFKTRVSPFTINNKLHMHGFVGMRPGPNNSWCDIDGVGTEYMNLSQDPMFQGQIQDLCNANWDLLLGNLAQNIISTNSPTSHSFQQRLDGSRPVTVRVNGQVLAQNQFMIDPNSNSITITGVQSLPAQSNVVVEYFPSQG